jgi:hypothetical protein
LVDGTQYLHRKNTQEILVFPSTLKNAQARQSFGLNQQGNNGFKRFS